MMRNLLLLAAPAAALVTAPAADPAADLGLRVDPDTGALLDADGRERVFHGVNVVYKSAPYLPPTDSFDPQTSFSEEDAQTLATYGLNVIRLGAMWPGLEPTRGSYNQTYLDHMHDIVDLAADYGVYTLLDAHQDVFSEKFCGEGVPLWAAQPKAADFPKPMAKEPYATDADGVPSREDCLSQNWPGYYASRAASSAFHALYTDQDGLAASFGDFWATLAGEFAQSPVIGIELLNEPWAGDIFSDPSLLWPGVADKKLLLPFYDGLADAIYAVDDSRLLLWESVTWTDIEGLAIADVGFDRVPGTNVSDSGSVFAWHYYPAPNFGMERYLAERVADAKRLGAGRFITEFGISNEAESADAFADMSAQMDAFDADVPTSWIGWEYKPYAGADTVNGTCTGCGPGLWHADGEINLSVAKAVSRTYAPAVAGTTQSVAFNSTTGDFSLTFDIDPLLANAVTEIFVQEELWYPDGFQVDIEPHSAATWSQAADGKLHVVSASGSRETVTVRVSPASV